MKLLIVDAMNLIRRVYAAVEDTPTAIEATTNRCIATIHNNMEWLQCSHLVMVYESEGDTWRHRLWPDYKLGRAPMPDRLNEQLEVMKARFEHEGIPCMHADGWEADDVCATLASRASKHGIDSIILSTDKGFSQLVNEHIHVANHFDRQLIDPDGVLQRFGLPAGQLVDFWAMTGDSTNHLPGVAGLGPKSASAILDEVGSLDRALIQIDRLLELGVIKPAQASKIHEHWQDALLTRELARLTTDVPVQINLKQLRYEGPQQQRQH